ncbi:MAG TPA: YicC family protein [Deltaproteobacteria bacterium]|nr:MAG: YicC family protein [Deltaproteobacteria bacterium GWA2_45_12]HBF13903.1 YicC family protein [Deltaproteobacteria bacterium]
MQSMTGMGRARGKVGTSYITIELKSVNHRYCEVHSRLLPRFQGLEISITQAIKKRLSRGKVDVTILEERSDLFPSANLVSIKKYYDFLKQVKKHLKLSEEITLAHIQHGSSFWLSRDHDTKADEPKILMLLSKALDELVAMRKKEGDELARQLEKRKKNMEALVEKVATQRENVKLELQERLTKRIQKYMQGLEIDQARLSNEIVFYVDRTDISEEIERLHSHFKQAGDLFKSKEPCGRPLDFLVQEMFREWNTIGSKCQDTVVAFEVVTAKTELEKIREQIQNIE